MRRILLAIVVLAVCSSVFASNLQMKYIKSDTDNYPLIVSSVQVLDSFEKPILDLESKQFTSIIDGKRSDSTHVMTYKDSGQPLYIMLCLDVSGSMRGTPLNKMKESVLQFIEDIRNIDKIAIYTFADDAILVSDFTNNKEYLRNKVNGLHTQGTKTALYYGVHKSLQKLKEENHRGGKILLLVGDGKDENPASSYTEDDVINSATEQGIPLFSLGYSAIDKSFLQSFERMSDKTGGTFYHSPSLDELQKRYKLIYEQILNIYLLQYVNTGVIGDGMEHQLVINLEHKGNNKAVSSKIVLPLAINEIDANKDIIIEESDNYRLLGIILGSILVIIVLIIFFINKSKKDKRKFEEQKRQLEEEKRISENQLREQIKVKEIAEEKVVEDAEKKAETAIVEKQAQRERTMIVDYNISSPKLSKSDKLLIEIIIGYNSGAKYNVDSNGATIGRKEGNSILLAESTVSSNHARIYHSDDVFYIEDLGSTNGTYINGNKVQIQQLRNNDTFKIGAIEGKIVI